ncbi:hypothetical protein F2Q69_00028448 [Brassica cretica]|uniref:Uncharacterized protein n=1 Tax=Brassica cretica TaxID=69181 RepID=A0A8S9S0C7_BRACR|nr:hypothetical protein F2Q69_00028448 [Brassica cretica]
MLRIVCAKTGTSKCGQRVIVGDVASRAGMKVTEAQKALQALAADTNGFLEVFPWFDCMLTDKVLILRYSLAGYCFDLCKSKKTKDDVYLKLTIKIPAHEYSICTRACQWSIMRFLSRLGKVYLAHALLVTYKGIIIGDS